MDIINAVLISIIFGLGYRYLLEIFYNPPFYFSVAIGSIIACLTLIYLIENNIKS